MLPQIIIIWGNINMHSVLWENQLDPDPRGDKLIECIFVNNLSVLNNDDGPVSTRVRIMLLQERLP